jgi:hypothetical protein
VKIKKHQKNAIQIHGKNYKLIPLKKNMLDIKVENGEHFITLNKYEELNKIINLELDKIKTEH